MLGKESSMGSLPLLFVMAKREYEYHYLCKNPHMLVQQLAVALIPKGYFFYSMGYLKEDVDPLAVDEKILLRYDLLRSKFTRYRDAKAGGAKVQYLRCGRFHLLIATRGKHPFFLNEPFLDIRENPIVYWGYSVSYRGGQSSVRIHKNTFNRLRAKMIDLALRPLPWWIEFWREKFPFEPYKGTVHQQFIIRKAVNMLRREAGLEEIPFDALRLKRANKKPFIDGAGFIYARSQRGEAEDG